MRLSQYSPYDLRTEKFINPSLLGENYCMQADQNEYFAVYKPNGDLDCWKILTVELLTSDDWDIVKEPGF